VSNIVAIISASENSAHAG